MEQNSPVGVRLQRITVIDALRGFALLGVILIHMLQQFGYFSDQMFSETKFSMLDSIILWFSYNIIAGRFINIFSFLFGLSFFIQMDRASKKGIDFRGRFLWRMVLLFVIGLIGICFSYVDILTFYAVFGVILVLLFPFKNWILILVTFLMLSGIPQMTAIGFDNIIIEQNTLASSSLPISLESENIDIASITENTPFMQTSFFESAKENLTTNMKGKLYHQFVLSSRGYVTLALFIIGFMIGRARFFEEVHVKPRRNIALFIGFMVAAIVIEFIDRLILPNESINLKDHLTRNINIPLISIISASLKDFGSLLQSGVLVMGFIILHQLKGIGKYLDVLSPYGRMGLSNYEAQGVIGAILFSGWGFGAILGRWGITELFVVGLVIYTLQIIISKFWLKHFLYGPLEWIWRSGTYLKWQPLKKTNYRVLEQQTL